MTRRLLKRNLTDWNLHLISLSLLQLLVQWEEANNNFHMLFMVILGIQPFSNEVIMFDFVISIAWWSFTHKQMFHF